METTTAPATGQPASTKHDRWLFLLIITLALNLAALILFPMFLTDALTPALTAICGVPAAWGLYTMLGFRTEKSASSVTSELSELSSGQRLWSACSPNMGGTPDDCC